MVVPDVGRAVLSPAHGAGPHAVGVRRDVPYGRGPRHAPADAVRDRLVAHNASLAIVDREEDPAAEQPVVGPVTYVRLRREEYGDADLDEWAARLRDAAGKDPDRDIYAFVKHDDEGHGPRYAR